MASGLLALFDDIATLMKHTSVLTKVAAKKTAGLVGDDLAVNAEAMIGINPKRELAIVAEVAKGSTINKFILIPAALGLSAVAPAIIPYFLMAGGAFLCYEGYHKTFDKHGPKEEEHKEKLIEAAQTSTEATLALEKKKIKQAVTTDFILSAEIIAIALGTMATATLATQAVALGVIGLGMTVIVYGSVAGLVKLDDLALLMMQNKSQGLVGKALRKTGEFMLTTGVPGLMKGLSVFGTAAMFIVGGEILLHGIAPVHHALEAGLAMLPAVPGLSTVVGMGAGLAAGVAAGFVTATAWKVTGPTITKALSPVGRAFGTALKKAKGVFPAKKNDVTLDIKQSIDTPAQVTLPVIEPAKPLQNMPDPKADLNKATAPVTPVPTAEQIAATSVTLNAHRRL